MVVVRAVLTVLAVAFIAVFMYGLKRLFFFMGQDFALGAVFGMFFMLGLLWLHFKATGKDIFTPD